MSRSSKKKPFIAPELLKRIEAMNAEGKKERYPMFHIVSPGELYEEGISVEDLYFPIERK